MAILKNPGKNNFTVVGNYALRDMSLSLKARGLLVTMLSLPDNWQFSESGLCSIFEKDGQASIRSGLKELEAGGYLVRKRTRDDHGRVSSVEWVIFDKPHLENPNVVTPNLENRPQLNTKESSIKESNTRESKDSLVCASRCASDDGFAAFWAAYPKKKSKGQALSAWKKLKPDSYLQAVILKAIEAQKRSPDWQKDKGKYIPYPATWLNAMAWEDEVPAEQNRREVQYLP